MATTVSIEDRLADVEEFLHRADEPGKHEMSIGALIIAISQLLEVVRLQQAEIERLTRESLDHVH